MTLRELELFLALAKNPHLTKVAKENWLSQSAVSMAIKSLECKLGEKLFDRINKRLILNEKGRMFYQEVEPLVLSLKEAENFFKKEKLSGHLKIGASNTIADYILPQIIYSFLDNFREVKIDIETGNSNDIVYLIEKGRVDIGFVEGEFNSDYIKKEILGEDELVVLTGDKKLASKKEYHIDELLKKKWIMREKGSGTREIFFKYLGEYAKELNIFMELDHTEAIKLVLNSRDCLSCLSRFSVKEECINKKLFKLSIKGVSFKRLFYLICHQNKYQSYLLKEFILFVKKEFRTVISAAEIA
ncbi:LysR family transcriptional regulator [Desulfohalobiaceae bacterium Ax17]|uniref:LysR family transcriptional regulator n=1 Tax=Desulfovulcanus ferrireducens TaxID=2831190 RepID=UPI00207BB487|nr:LysR family transcriptional regulator [Desulfovulcanus ferrireducens]MBT8763680.1 LysR family transcriptional regulator [Desulfovulcanus ferrireducens]